MRIGIDIDDTITNTQDKIDEIAKNIENMEIYDRSKHWFYERYNCSLEVYDKFLRKHIENFMNNVSIKKDANYYINKLHDEGNEIYIITFRSMCYSKNVPDITKEYLNRYNIKYDKLIFNSKDKANICLENNIDIMVDDSTENILDIENIGVKTIVMDNEYNKDINTSRAYSWKDVYEIVVGDNYRR